VKNAIAQYFAKALGLQLRTRRALAVAIGLPDKKKYRTPFYTRDQLAFLGDGVIHFFVCEQLIRHEGLDPALASKMASMGWSNKRLASILQKSAVDIYLQDLLHNQDLPNAHSLGTTYEALVGALYIERGIREAKRFLQETLHPEMQWKANDRAITCPITELAKYVRQVYRTFVEYRVFFRNGKFVAQALIFQRSYDSATGKTSKEAKVRVATNLLDKITSKKIAISARM
jgi:ribonuclease-3